jgi:hypothetical protein
MLSSSTLENTPYREFVKSFNKTKQTTKPFYLKTFTFSLNGLKAKHTIIKDTIFDNGYLGSLDDEERSEMRYVM